MKRPPTEILNSPVLLLPSETFWSVISLAENDVIFTVSLNKNMIKPAFKSILNSDNTGGV